MAKGNYTNAYIGKERSGFDPTAWLHKEQDRQIAIDEIQRRRDEEDRKRKSEDEKAFSDSTRYKVEIDPSKIPNVNAFKSAIFDAGKERVFELSKAMEKYKNDPYSPEYKKAEREIQYINDTLANQANLMTKAWEEDMIKASSGKYLLSPNQIKNVQSYASTPMEISLGEGGRVVIKRDNNNDGTLDLLTKDEFVNGNLLGKLVPNVDENTFLKGLNIGDVKIDEMKGLTTTTETNPWETNIFGDETNPRSLKNVVTETIKSQIMGDNGKLNELGESFAYKRGIYDTDNISQEEIDLIAEDLAEAKRSELGYEKSIKRERVYGGGGGKTISSDGIFQSIAKNRTRPTKSVWGDKISPDDRFSVQPAKMVQIGNRTEMQLPTMNIVKDLDTNKTYSNATIESYAYDKKGNMYAKISYVTDKGSTESIYEKDIESGKRYVSGKAGNPQSKGSAVIRIDSDTKRDIANFLEISMDDLWNLGVEKNNNKGVSTTNKKPAYKGLDKDGNPIFE